MKGIAGIIPVSMIDFEGKIACVIFFSGCNFRCSYCHNPELIDGKETGEVKEEDVFSYLESKKKWLDGVSITGGEPLLNKDIIEFISKIKKIGLLVKLDTNGTSPDLVKKLIDEKLIDYIAMDIKAGEEDYERITGVKVDISKIKKTIRVIMNSGIKYEFRTTLVPGLIGVEDIKKAGKLIEGAKLWYIQNFNNEKNLDRKLSKIEPYLMPEMEKMKIEAEKYAEEARIR